MLPKISYPTYDLKLPSTGAEVTIRPFLVREEKLLLMALESNEQDDIINTTKQVINNCIIKGDVDVDKLPFFDVDYLFIALRAKSVGESIDIKFTCNNRNAEGNRCGATFDAQIDIANVKVKKDERQTLDISLGGSLSVRMKYPSYATMKIISASEDEMSRKIRLLASCVDMIIDGEQVHTIKDVTKDEIVNFIENLTQGQYKRLEEFIDNLPYFVVTAQHTCQKCGFQHNLEYNDFASFFV